MAPSAAVAGELGRAMDTLRCRTILYSKMNPKNKYNEDETS